MEDEQTSTEAEIEVDNYVPEFDHGHFGITAHPGHENSVMDVLYSNYGLGQVDAWTKEEKISDVTGTVDVTPIDFDSEGHPMHGESYGLLSIDGMNGPEVYTVSLYFSDPNQMRDLGYKLYKAANSIEDIDE